MICPDCKTDENVIKNGLRSTKKGKIQRYYCKSRNFSGKNSKRVGISETEIPTKVARSLLVIQALRKPNIQKT